MAGERNQAGPNYNARQDHRGEKHPTHACQMLGTYTWSHSLDVSSQLMRTSGLRWRGQLPTVRPSPRDYDNSAFDGASTRFHGQLDLDIPNLNKLSSSLGCRAGFFGDGG